jgi:nucleotide-binding universal stress UspA family protein
MNSLAKPLVIVVGTDYSETATLALERAFELAMEQPAAHVHVVHAFPMHWRSANLDFPTFAPSLRTPWEQLQLYVEAALQLFEERCGSHCRGLSERVTHHLLVDRPAEGLAGYASDVEADLLLIGTHGRSGLTKLVVGSVAEAVLRLAPCQVLVVRPKPWLAAASARQRPTRRPPAI